MTQQYLRKISERLKTCLRNPGTYIFEDIAVSENQVFKREYTTTTCRLVTAFANALKIPTL
jgi:hypothetical protein